MCGLVGMFGTLERKHVDTMEDFLMVCQVRGRDSTGVFKVDLQDRVDWIKQVGTPEFLTQGRSYGKRVSGKPAKVLAGHCRHTTVGESNLENAHPFEHNHVTGMHNGTLRSWKTGENAANFEVDSDWLMWSISEFGAAETFSNLDENSAYACVWYDEKTNSLQFIRNSKRPLWFVWSKDLKTVFYASEIWMFGVVQRETGIDFWNGGENGEKYVQLPVDSLWSFKIDHTYLANKKSLTMAPVEMIAQKKRTVAGNFSAHGTTGSSYGNSYTNRSAYNPAEFAKDPKTGMWLLKEKGGEVTDPFQGASRTLDDAIDDIGKKGTLPKTPKELLALKELQKKGTTPLVEGSTTTGGTKDNSKNTSSNVLDFRMGKKVGKSSSEEEDCLVLTSLETVPLDNRGSLSKRLKGTTGKLVSLRNVAGESYVTNNKTGREFSERGIENITKGLCSFCENPIGGLEEIGEFINDSKFICTECLAPKKKIALA